jgi:hypothetical protein
MCAHKVDAMGYPVDPHLRSLQAHLSNLAAMWRYARRSNDIARQQELVRGYHDTLEQLYALGWDDGLDIEAELPHELMPEEYFQRAELRREQLRKELQQLKERQ